MHLISAEQITQSIGRKKILHGITLHINLGIFGLLGPNGAGKTTLLRTLATVLPPASGSLHLLEYDVSDSRQRRMLRRVLGYLPQHLGYYPDFTVREFVEYIALLKEMPHATIGSAVALALERVQLTNKAGLRMRELSGGMLRRAGIAQAIVNTPRILLLDEPTAGLDPQQRIEFRTLLRELGRVATVVVSTHLVEDVAAACQTVAILNEGRLIFSGTPQGLQQRGTGAESLGDTPLERGYTATLQELSGTVWNV